MTSVCVCVVFQHGGFGVIALLFCVTPRCPHHTVCVCVCVCVCVWVCVSPAHVLLGGRPADSGSTAWKAGWRSRRSLAALELLGGGKVRRKGQEERSQGLGVVQRSHYHLTKIATWSRIYGGRVCVSQNESQLRKSGRLWDVCYNL